MTTDKTTGPLGNDVRRSRLVTRWWALLDWRVGIVPVPVFLVLACLISAFAWLAPPTTVKPAARDANISGLDRHEANKSGTKSSISPSISQKTLAADSGTSATKAAKQDPNTFPADILMNIAVLAVGGFACAEIGKRLPLLRRIGAGAIFATFLPSYLVYAHLLPPPLVASVKEFTKESNFLYLFISAIIVGSILGMDRRMLISGFLKIFVPMAAGSLAAMVVGSIVGVLVGLGLHKTFFFVIAPVLSGGVGEGAIPLSIGYSALTHQDQGELFAQILPSVMMGSLTALIISGGLSHLGERVPRLTGNGRLQAEEHDIVISDSHVELDPGDDNSTIAAAGVTAVTLYLAGVLLQRLTGFPAPVTMLALTVGLKLGQAISPQLERGALGVYRFFSTAVTYPLLFAIGVSLTPWDKLLASFTLPILITIAATVSSLVGVGFAVGHLMRMYPIDVAIVTSCRAAQGGTGDVAILTAAGRMQLMPFAQIATRIGGALTVTLTLIVLARFG